jgi:hypothetical protein
LLKAQQANRKAEVRKIQKAIQKENTTHDAKRPLLERRVLDLGGTLPGPADAER